MWHIKLKKMILNRAGYKKKITLWSNWRPWVGVKMSNILQFLRRCGDLRCRPINCTFQFNLPQRADIASKSVTCLATDVCLTADPGVTSSIPARSHTFVEIDHEITSTVILLPSADSFKKGCCQLQAKVCAQITG